MYVNRSSKKFSNTADIHKQEHEKWNRRSFLKALGMVGGGSMMLANTRITASKPSLLTNAISDSITDRILVLVRLKGGNDGLNTIVPIYDYDNYANLRPTIRHFESSLFKLDQDFGIPGSMSNLQSMWGDGAMKVVHGVGYENQSLSHFKSSDIWASSDDSDEEDSGYLGRYFEEIHPDFLANPPEIPAAIQIGSIGNLTFDGRGVLNYAMTVANPEQLRRIAENGALHGLDDIPDCTYGERLEFLRSMTNNTFTYGEVIGEKYSLGSNSVAYLDDNLGKQFSIIARMIKGGLGTRVYMISLGGFDTHGNQIDRHNELMLSVSHGIKTFYEDLSAAGMEKNVLTTTVSEFGRRARENGSEGTDHGTSAPVMLFGPALDDNGFIGEHPSLSNLDRRDNMTNTFDYKEVYANLMKEWLCIDPETVDRALLGNSFEPNSDFGITCAGLIEPIDSFVKFNHEVIQGEDGSTWLFFEKGDTSHVNITLFSITGAKIATLYDDVFGPGSEQINVSQKVGGKLNQAIYVYRILSGNKSFSNQLFVR